MALDGENLLKLSSPWIFRSIVLDKSRLNIPLMVASITYLPETKSKSGSNLCNIINSFTLSMEFKDILQSSVTTPPLYQYNIYYILTNQSQYTKHKKSRKSYMVSKFITILKNKDASYQSLPDYMLQVLMIERI